MRTITQFIIVSVLLFPSAFFILDIQNDYFNSVKKVEALCSPGEYSERGTGDCKVKSFGGTDPTEEMESFLVGVMNTITAILLAGSIISFVYSGFEFIRYGTNPSSAERAKQRVLHTGLAIVILLSSITIFSLIRSIVW